MVNADDMNGARTDSMFNSLLGLLKGSKRNHSGVRLIDELMVDIMGGLIPGVLFIFSLLVCIIVPIVIYDFTNKEDVILANHSMDNHILIAGGASHIFTGWFWFAAFLTFLILSYIAGHIFYRADINKADREDIKRRMKRNSSEVKSILSKSRIKKETIQELLKTELSMIVTDENAFSRICGSQSEANGFKTLLLHINNRVKDFNQDNISDKDKLLYALSVIFPHKTENSTESNTQWINPCNQNEDKNQEKSPESLYLKIDELRIYNDFFKLASVILDNSTDKYEKSFLACYLILLLQNESGCSHFEKIHEKHSYFPYLSFYKYLIKRSELDLIKYVDWSPAGARTKNKINRMKIDIQLDYPDAYAILNKNESHIRMASSSWHVSRIISELAKYCSAIIVFIFLINSITFLITNGQLSMYLLINCIKNIFVIFPPILLYILMKLMKREIEKFIHYQRLREIYFTLFIFHKLEENKRDLSNNLIKNIADCNVLLYNRLLYK